MHTAKRLAAILLCLALLAALFAGCKSKEKPSSEDETTNYPVTIGDLTLSEKPERVVVLSENLADIILALGYEASLKGKSPECTQSELSILPEVSLSDLKTLKDLEPDLVLVDTEPENAEELALQGIPVAVVPPATGRSDFEREYSDVGSLLNGKIDGAAFAVKRAQDIFLAIDDITRMAPSSNIVITACYLYDMDGTAATGDTLAGALISATGATNAFENTEQGDTTLAALKLSNPNYIFCPTGLKEQILASEELSGLSAVENGLVYEMDPTYMIRQGRTVLQAVNFMSGVLYPELLDNAASDPASSAPSSGDGENGDSSAIEPSSNSSDPDSSSEPSSSSSSDASTTSGSSDSDLKVGAKGNDVLKLQKRLAELGYFVLEPTGEFGEGTEQALMNFQLYNGLLATGVANAETIKTLYSSSAIPADQTGSNEA